MKCPNCGHWNRASFPRCFKCGVELPKEDAPQQPPQWKEDLATGARDKRYIQIDEDGNATAAKDERDLLAEEMKSLIKRKAKGEELQMHLRENAQEKGFAGTSRSVQDDSGRSNMHSRAQRSVAVDYPEQVLSSPRRDAASSQRSVDYDDYSNTATYQQLPSSTRAQRVNSMTSIHQMKLTRGLGMRRPVRIAALILLIATALAAAYMFVVKPIFLDKAEPTLQEQVIITPSIYEDATAHTIRIPGEEGSEIYIKELRKFYQVIGGYATIEVPDHTWYDDEDSMPEASLTVTLTPYLKTSAGEQKLMEVITYDIDVPLSPIILVDPSVTYLDVKSRPIYAIQFMVEKNSSVTINGENLSDLVNNQNGLISYNATIQAIGNNVFTIVVRTPHYRENIVTLTLYREKQDIPLDFSVEIEARSIEKTKPFTMKTLDKAQITVVSPHENLDLSKLSTTGTFTFDAVFNTVGTNTVVVEASYPGLKTHRLEYDVYYVPNATEYTKKAWALAKSDYKDLLSNIVLRKEKSQIYLCQGQIVEIISPNRQLAIMETGTAEESRQVLLENYSSDTWVVGESYRVYADVYGLYNGIPRLNGRYTYPIKK